MADPSTSLLYQLSHAGFGAYGGESEVGGSSCILLNHDKNGLEPAVK